jgi:hypothetical protein
VWRFYLDIQNSTFCLQEIPSMKNEIIDSFYGGIRFKHTDLLEGAPIEYWVGV